MVTVIDYGVGNLFSLESSFSYIGEKVKVTGDPEEISKAEKLVLPGVGAFRDAAEKLKNSGFDTGNSQSAIIPVMIRNEAILFEMYDKLRKKGVYVNIVTYPATRRKECRLRLCAMKDLSYKQIDKAVDIISSLGREYKIIN